MLGGYQGILTRQIGLQIQQRLVTQGVIWWNQSSLTQHHQLMVLRRRRLICTWLHIITSHSIRVVAVIGCWDYIFLLKLIIDGYQFLGAR